MGVLESGPTFFLNRALLGLKPALPIALRIGDVIIGDALLLFKPIFSRQTFSRLNGAHSFAADFGLF